MRWIVISLVLFNVGYLLWNWLEYSHSRELQVMNASAGAYVAEMPGARLMLLSERAANAPQVVAKPSEVTTPAAVPAAAAPTPPADPATALCLLLGPFADQQAGKPVYERMVALDIHARLASIEIEGDPDYWVYLKPEATRELAMAKLRELQEKKIDSFIIPQGEIANGISLGVFDKEDNAERRRQAVIERGYEALVRANPRIYLENWLVIYPEEAGKFSPELYEQLHGENNKLDLRKEQCSKVASIIDIH